MKRRLLIVDDHDIVREGLRSLLRFEGDVEAVGEAADGRGALDLVRQLSPDLVLMDITMPDLNGLDATRQIVAMKNGTKVIALSMHADRQFVAEVFKAGASGYLLKDAVKSELPPALRAVGAGKVYLSPGVTDIVVEDYVRRTAQSPEAASDTLSTREREVLQLLAEGKTSKEIAAALHLSRKTVESHRAQLMERLDIHTVAELTKYAIRHGITSLER